MKTLNVVIESHDRPKILTACIESILKYTDIDDYVITIVANKSKHPDKITPIYEQYVSKYPHIKVIEGTDNLFLTSRNIGVNAEEAEVYVEIDDDILVNKGWISSIIKLMRENPDIGLAVPLLTFRVPLFYAKQIANIETNMFHLLSENISLNDLKRLHDYYEEELYCSDVVYNYIDMFEYSCVYKSNRMKKAGCLLFDEYFDNGRNACRANEDFQLRMDDIGFKSVVVRSIIIFHIQTQSFIHDDPRRLENIELALHYFYSKLTPEQLKITDERLAKNIISGGGLICNPYAKANMIRGYVAKS